MSRYFFDPNDHATGTTLTDLGWTVDRGAFNIEDDHDNNGRGHLVYQNFNAVVQEDSNYTAYWPDPDSNNYPVEVVGLVHGVTGAHYTSGVAVGSLDRATAYAARISSDFSSVEILEHDGNLSRVVLASGAINSNISDITTERVWIRILAEGSGSGILRAKAWLDTDSEPSDWQVSVDVGSSYHGQKVGFRSNLSDEDHYFWRLGVGTNGDYAPTSNAVIFNVPQAAETNTAHVLSLSKTINLDQALETDTARSITVAKSLSVSQAVETNTARGITFTKTINIPQALESDTARTISLSKTINIAQATETDTAHPVSMTTDSVNTIMSIAQATEINEARAVTITKTIDIAQALETDTAHNISVSVSGLIANERKSNIQGEDRNLTIQYEGRTNNAQTEERTINV